jgi:hypothetical protein
LEQEFPVQVMVKESFLVLCVFRNFQGCSWAKAAPGSRVECFPVFRQTLQLSSSRF